MTNKSSINIQPCNVRQSEAHNWRKKEYMRNIKKEHITIRTEFSMMNRHWVAPELRYTGLPKYLEMLAALVKEKTGRAMQMKVRERVNKKTGRVSKVNGCSALKEGVIICKESTTMRDLMRFCQRCQEQWGITAIQIHIHRDEGSWTTDEPRQWKSNLHAHIVWDWIDHSTGKTFKLNQKDMSEMQDMAAETLGMERGTRKEETGLEHLSRNDYILAIVIASCDKLSEDVDIALSHRFFNQPIENNNQLKNLRKACRKYLIEEYPALLSDALRRLGVVDFKVEPETALHGIPISSDADPMVINVKYKSIAEHQSDYMQPVVKVEISCLSLEEPSVTKTLTSIINEVYPEVDNESVCDIPTVHPLRTFLEKAFLLCEEFQKDVPRSLRMSRHLYDLVCMMDTSFGVEALKDMELYRTIVEHRRKFYHLGYANYDKDYPQHISFLPPESCSSEYEQDYYALLSSFVYGQAPTYQELIAHLKELETRFHNIK